MIDIAPHADLRPAGQPDPILFDLDGTLTESGPGVMASVRHALELMGEQVPGDDVLRRFIGPPLADSFRDFCGMDADRVRVAIGAYREHYAEHGQYENSVYEGIPEVLETLSAAGRTLAVATSKAQLFADGILNHFGLAEHFALILGSEFDGSRTRKSDVLREVLARLGRPGREGVLIGDRYHDVFGATSVGMPCIGALWGYGSPEELTSAGATALAQHPSDVPAMVGVTSG
ncbi:MAG: HAD hydrolase-like protein [Candidatus Nanopelagicales bacterium]